MIIRVSTPADHIEVPCLPLHPPRSLPSWRNWAPFTSTTPAACAPTSSAYPTRVRVAGRWYPLVGMLLICACAVVSGARTIDRDRRVGTARHHHGAGTASASAATCPDAGAPRPRPPSPGSWPLSTAMPWTPRSAPTWPTPTTPASTATGSAPRPAIAVDGKALSGSAHRQQRHRHLLSAVTHAPAVTLAQVEVGAKTNETTAFRPLLEPLDLTGTVVTFDALHSVKDQVRWLVETKKAHYIAVIKDQPADRVRPSSPPCRGTSPRPAHRLRDRTRPARVPLDQDRGHRRRTSAGSPSRDARLAIRVHRRRQETGKRRDPGDGLRRHQPRHPPGQPPPTWPPRFAGTGESKTPPTTSEMSPSPRTPPPSTPAAHHGPWPPSATSPSADCRLLGADNIAKTTRAIRDAPEHALWIWGITDSPLLPGT